MITLLANLHGDAIENCDVIALLNHCFQCRYLTFVMPTCTKTQWRSFTAMIPSKDHISFIRVDPKDYVNIEPNDIQTSRITEGETLHKVRSCLGEALKSCSVVHCISTHKESPRVSLADGIETETSQKIIDFVARNTCKSTKVQLQVQSYNMQNVKVYSAQMGLCTTWLDISSEYCSQSHT